MKIEKHLLRVPVTTGASFDRELQDLLSARCKLAYGAAFAIAALSYIFFQAVVNKTPEIAETPLAPWHKLAYGLYPIVFALTVAILVLREWSSQQLLLIDQIVINFAILLALFTSAVFFPTQLPVFGVALLLFVHAAIIPVQTGYQVTPAAVTVIGYPFAMLAAYQWMPGVKEYWGGVGGDSAFRDMVLEGTFSLGALAAISVLITQALYGMRKSLHKARSLGNYVIERELGQGGMGRVFMAQHALLCRPTAIKTLEAIQFDGRPGHLKRFEREVRLSATLTHPNTITIYDFGRSSDDTFYYAMEYLEGLDLQRLVERFGSMPPERAVYILRQVCGALAEAHARGIIHRDIKPSNIFLTNRGGLFDFVKVLDFGLAKQVDVDDTSTLTQDGALFGTPRYMAPEMVYGKDEVDNRADIYNVGGVAYWMVTGHAPFESESSVEVIVDHVKTEPKPPSTVTEVPIPEELDGIILRCLEKKPSDRFQTALELLSALDGIQFEEPWDEDRACSWWSLHAPEDVRISECVRHATEGSLLLGEEDEEERGSDVSEAAAAQ
jgi:serine/threonine-protein kinase